jgi:uracil-DNA glycosylase
MRPCDKIGCERFPCVDVNHSAYHIPEIDLDPERVSIILISEAAPTQPADGYYAGGSALFAQTTIQAFNDAGAAVTSIQDVLDLGVYLTTAVKCGKTGYGIQTASIENCSRILEEELALFPNVKAYLLMGDVAIKSVNSIARRAGVGRVIPAGSTYKIRGQAYYFRNARAFPSYLQAGPAFFIEKSKRKMIAEDLAAALALAG